MFFSARARNPSEAGVLRAKCLARLLSGDLGVERLVHGRPLGVKPQGSHSLWAFWVTRFLALSQQQALKGPLSKLNWIGHAIRSERHKLLTEGSLEFEISFEITKGIASLHDYPRGFECLCQRLKRLRVVRINLGAHYSPHALQAGVLGSQPSVPVIALTGDSAVCAFLRRIASQEMGAAVGVQDNRVWVRSGSLADISHAN